MKINTVYILYLQFTEQHRSSAQEVMKMKVLSKIDCKKHIWITIDNSISKDVEIVQNFGFYSISGDNSSREFSGFDKGVKLLKSLKPQPNDLVIFANDTFHRSYGNEYLDLITKSKIEEAQSRQSVLGYVDSFPEPVVGFGRTFSSWIRTSFFMLNYSLVDRLIPFTIPRDKNTVFGMDTNEFFVENDLLSANYKEFIRTWLFDSPSEESQFKESWHSKKALTNENLKSMQEKAWCILCEQQLSARLVENRIPILKING